jgi:peptidoglycan hydrolase-like protein with peptidoglycan-binding domain
MKQWTRGLALTIAVLFVAGPAWAQGTTTTPADKPAEKGTTGTTGAAEPKADTGAVKADKGMKGDRPARAGSEQVKQVQQALKDKGHDPGDIDGVMGPKTQAALKDFQKKEGLKETGRMDRETMSKLGVEMKTEAGSPAASPPTGEKAPSGEQKTDQKQ